MEADMAEAWQTLEEAALTLGISSRTLHRRLARGEFQTRMANGRREVLVVVDERDPSLDRLAAAAQRGVRFAAPSAVPSDTADAAADTAADTNETAYSSDDYATTIDTAGDEVQQTMLALHEDRIRRTDLAIMAYQQSVTVAASDARRAVTRSRVAWSVAGVMSVALSLGGMWATHRLTAASGEVSHLSASVRQLSDSVDAKSHEIRELRQESQTAKVAAARAEGELAAARRQVEQLTEAQQAAMAAARLSAQTAMADAPDNPATQPSVMSVNSASAQLASSAPAAPATPATPAATQPSVTTQPVGR
jgi:outer membrane murein-binding lipoprotein Lpp